MTRVNPKKMKEHCFYRAFIPSSGKLSTELFKVTVAESKRFYHYRTSDGEWVELPNIVSSTVLIETNENGETLYV